MRPTLMIPRPVHLGQLLARRVARGSSLVHAGGYLGDDRAPSPPPIQRNERLMQKCNSKT